MFNSRWLAPMFGKKQSSNNLIRRPVGRALGRLDAAKNRAFFRRALVESLEQRQLLAADVFASDTFLFEAGAGASTNDGQFEVKIGAPQATDTLITYAFSGDNTGPGLLSTDDFNAQVNSVDIPSVGTLTILAGDTSVFVDIDINDDALYDGALETIVLNLSSSSTEPLGISSASMAIVDDEVPPTVGITNPGSSAATEGGADAQFLVTLSGAASDTDTVVTVVYPQFGANAAVEGGATDDFTAPSSVTITAGNFTSTIDIVANDESLVEGLEVATALLSGTAGPTNPGISASGSAAANINDNDSATVSLTTMDAVASESDDGGTDGPADFTIQLTNPASSDTVVSYTIGGTATANTDYTLGRVSEVEANNTIAGPQVGTGAQGLGGFSLNFDAGIPNSTTRPHVSIDGTGDGSVDLYAFYAPTASAVARFDVDGADFDARLRLFDSSGAEIATANAGGSNDAVISTTLGAAGLYYIGVFEGTGTIANGNGPDAGRSYELEVSVDNADGFAVVGAGSTQLKIPVTVINDTLVEGTETVTMQIGSATVVSDPQITVPGSAAVRTKSVNINDDDEATVEIDGTMNAIEPTTNGLFTITQSLASSENTVIPFTVTGSALFNGGTAQNPVDYNLTLSNGTFNPVTGTGQVTILANTTSATISVNVIDSDLIEEDESVVVTLGTPVGPTDPQISVSTASDAILIGDEDDGVIDVDSTVSVAVEGGVDGEFTFFLSQPPGFAAASPVSATSDRDTVITYSISGDSPAATNGADYTTLTGTATIPAFSSSTSILVDAVDDMVLEGTENVRVTITGVTGVTDSNITVGAGSPSDQVQIVDNAAHNLLVSIEGTSDAVEGGAKGIFTVKTSGTGTTTVPTVVTYQVKAGSSVAVEGPGPGADFAPLLGTITIPAGAASQSNTIEIDATGIYDDNELEGSENVIVEILSVAGGPGVSVDGANDEAEIDILDDETGEISIVATKDGAESFTPVVKNGEFLVTLDGASPLPVTVSYTVLTGAANDATPGSDYTALSGTVSLAPFMTSAVIPVNVINDMADENTENVRVQITGASVPGFTPSATNGSDTVRIYSDQVVSVAATIASASEDSTDGEFTFYLSTPGFGATASPTNTVVNFTVATGAGQATPGMDYSSIGSSVTILAGQTSATVPVNVLPDFILESTETVTLTLTSVSGTTHADIDVTGVAADKTATVSIADNDQAFVTIAAGPKAHDNNPAPDTDSNFIIEISDVSSANTLVGYEVVVPAVLAATDAQQGVDYRLRAGGSSGPILSGSTGVVTIPSMMSTTSIYVEILDDSIVELDESLTVKLTSVSNAANPNVFLGAIGGPVLVFQDGSPIYVGGPNYGGTLDSYLSSTNPSLNYGSDGELIVEDNGDVNQSVIRFTGLFGGGPGMIPVGSPIDSAILGFTALSGGVSTDLHEFVPGFFGGAPFDEATVTWNTYLFSGTGLQPGTELTGSPDATGTTSFDVTSSFAGGANPAKGWALLGAAAGSSVLASSESVVVSARPSLTVTIDLSATLEICDHDTATVFVDSVTDAVEPGTPGVVTLMMTAPSSTPTTVSLSDLGTGSALLGSDYNPVNTSVTFAPGVTVAAINVVPKNDSLVEGVETVDLQIDTLAGDSDIAFSPALPTGVTVNIQDNDFTFYSITSKTNGAELSPGGAGDPSGATDGQFNLGLTVPVDVDVAMPFTIGGSATAGADYVVRDAANNIVTPVAGVYTVTIPANTFGTSIKIDVTDDPTNEDQFESVSVSLMTPVPVAPRLIFPGATLGDSITIEDDEQTLAASVVASVPTTVEGGTPGQFTIGLNYASDQPTTIKYAISGTATAATNATSPDFDASALPGATSPSYVTGTIVLGAGATQVTLPVSAFEDFVDEGAETVVLSLTDVTNSNTVTGVGSNATVTINDDDYTVSVAKTDSPASEAPIGAGVTNGQFTFSINNPLPENTVILYSVVDTATPTPAANADYVALSGTATILAGQTTVTVDVDVLEDSIVEGDETVTVTITSASSNGPAYIFSAGVGPTIGVDATPATETITDDDSALVTIAGGSASESPVGAMVTNGSFTITQTQVASVNTVIPYVLVTTGGGAGTATLGADFTSPDLPTTTTTAYATITAGQTSATVAVNVVEDNIVEGSETVVVKILAPTAGDPQVTLGGTVQNTVTIGDDDTAIAFLQPADTDGSEPGANDGRITLAMNNPSSTNTVFTISDISSDPNLNASDYILRDAAGAPIVGGLVTITAGATTTSIIVDVLDDSPGVLEDNEIVTIDLLPGSSNGAISTMSGPQSVTIFDDDKAIVSVSPGVAPADENSAGAPLDGSFVVSIPKASDVPTVVTFSTAGSTAGAGDYVLKDGSAAGAVLSGSITIPAFATSATIYVDVTEDALAEATEEVKITLTGISSGHTGLVGGMQQTDVSSTPASIDILDDDSLAFTVTSESTNEGTGAGSTTLTFTITMTGTNDIPIAVNANYGGGTAMGGGTDYDSATDTVNFPANSVSGTTKTVTVAVNRENLVELNETFNVSLGTSTALGGRAVTFGSGMGTIVNDDTATFTINNASVVEGTDGSPGDGPFSLVTFDVSNSNPIDINYDVDVDFSDLTALGVDFASYLNLMTPLPVPADAVTGFDYDNATQTVTFDAGMVQTKSVSVRVLRDNFAEGPSSSVPQPFGSETFRADLTDATGTRSTIDTDSGTGTILDDDSALVDSSATMTPVVESAIGEFTVTQSNASSTPTVVTFTTSGSASASDFVLRSGISPTSPLLGGSITIPAGATSAKIYVHTVEDSELEDDETVILALGTVTSGDDNVSVNPTPMGPLANRVTILDNDTATVSVSASIAAASEPGTDGEFTFTLTDISDTDTVINYSVATGAGQATAGADYTALTGVATISAGDLTTTVAVQVIDDAIDEPAEDVSIAITGFQSPTNADITAGAMDSAVVTIDDDDGPITIKITGLTDGSEPENNGSFLVELLDENGAPVVAPPGGLLITYNTGGTAVSGGTAITGTDDYVMAPAIVVPSGQTTAIHIVDVENDPFVEPTETVEITLDMVTLLGAGYVTPPVGTTGTFVLDPTTASIDILDDDTFSVVEVLANNTAWGQDFRDGVDGEVVGSGLGEGYSIPTGVVADQLRPLPWAGINQLVVKFDEAIDPASVVANGNVNLLGTLAAPTISGIVVSGNEMTINLAGPITYNTLRLEIQDSVLNVHGNPLNGEFTNSTGAYPTLPSGDVFGGGDFGLQFAVNPGDTDGSGAVDFVDFDAIFAAAGGTVGGGAPYDLFADTNADGAIDFLDFDAIFANSGNMIPGSYPGGFLGGLSGEGEGDQAEDDEHNVNDSALGDVLGDFFK